MSYEFALVDREVNIVELDREPSSGGTLGYLNSERGWIPVYRVLEILYVRHVGPKGCYKFHAYLEAERV
ncbi:MAG TPA: hypothetical protein VJG30_03540 [Candidatus Nanoarchaeia archaeon]|nr:hypothetical protein [Candidatus Nanoarchaeia archaeon]